MTTTLAPQPITTEVLLQKYAKDGESTIGDVQTRVAKALASVEKNPVQMEGLFKQALEDGFVPAGRIMSAAGTDIRATLINCFVQPVGDAVLGVEDGYPGIYIALTEAAETMRRGGGVGYDFSRIRPKGAFVGGTHSSASGPVSYMHVFDRSCETVESAGARRGAQMGVLRCDHPDVLEFIEAKSGGALKNFNISVGVTDAFMEAAIAGSNFELVHKAAPTAKTIEGGAFQRADGKWVYKTVNAAEMFAKIMEMTYNHAEPGVLFLDRMNQENNLYYCEVIEATNPCAEEPLPPYGCCDLGSINLTRMVRDPFTAEASFDYEAMLKVVHVAVRMLDNVLDATYWPLEQQRKESENKRRVGLGYLGLGSALAMLGIPYNSESAKTFTAEVTKAMTIAAYHASVDLAIERGPFPLFDERYLEGAFVKRLPEDLRARIAKHGIRNSHLTAIAPTGTITLAFADNASNGIEPPFSLTYNRKKRMEDGTTEEFAVQDHAYRMYLAQGGDPALASKYFVTALQMTAAEHLGILQAAQPYIDTSISKTVNVPADYPFADFKALYLLAWKAGLKGLATYRPNAVTGAVLSVGTEETKKTQPSDMDDPDRRIQLDTVPNVTSALAYPSRPVFDQGNMAWTFMMEVPRVMDAGLFVGQDENGKPFEAWINGVDQPRGLGAVAKILSVDMRAGDPKWVQRKLGSMRKPQKSDVGGFDAYLPGDKTLRHYAGSVQYFASLVQYRYEQTNAFADIANAPTPIEDALLIRKEPKSKGQGTMSWTWDIRNDAAGDDCVLFVKEMRMPDGSVRPYSIWLAGEYPKALDGLCKLLSMDMWVHDPAWVGLKLRKLLNYAEPKLDFMAWVPGNGKQKNYPSTVAYIAAALLYRFKALGLLDAEGQAIRGGLVQDKTADEPTTPPVLHGKVCPECLAHALIEKDGCDYCTSCGYVGSCG